MAGAQMEYQCKTSASLTDALTPRLSGENYAHHDRSAHQHGAPPLTRHHHGATHRQNFCRDSIQHDTAVTPNIHVEIPRPYLLVPDLATHDFWIQRAPEACHLPGKGKMSLRKTGGQIELATLPLTVMAVDPELRLDALFKLPERAQITIPRITWLPVHHSILAKKTAGQDNRSRGGTTGGSGNVQGNRI